MDKGERADEGSVWASMFGVDGQDVANGLPAKATPGPNQALAEKMGVVMGTSHHEPMSRNQKEFDTFGHGDWSFTSNEDFLKEFWRYGAERAKGLETVYTVGMRGNGDLPLDGANTSVSPPSSIPSSWVDSRADGFRFYRVSPSVIGVADEQRSPTPSRRS
jgi:hypothetical protein